MLGVAHYRGRLKDFLQRAFALDEWHAAQVVAIEIEQVEHEQRDWDAARKVRKRIRIGHRDAGLNQAETGNSVLVEHGDLGVEDGLLRRDLMADHAQLRILPLLRAAISGAERDR